MASYTSMAVGVGPWISPVVIMFLSLFFKNRQLSLQPKLFFYLQQGALTAGLAATGVGFMLPTLFYLDHALFIDLIASPHKFIFLLSILSLCSLFWGFLLGRIFIVFFNNNPYVVPKMFYDMIVEVKIGLEKYFFWGSFVTAIVLVCKILFGLYGFGGLIMQISPSMTVVGFMLARHIFAFLIGFFFRAMISMQITKYVGLQDVNIVGVTAAILFIDIASAVIYNFWVNKKSFLLFKFSPNLSFDRNVKNIGLMLVGVALILIFCGKIILGFSALILILGLVISIPIIFKAAEFASMTGILPFGRFATFLMLPIFLLFQTTPIFTVLICVFIAVACAGAVSFLFNLHLGNLLKIETAGVIKSEEQTILITSILMPIVFWFIFQYLQIGSSNLFAYRGLSRALLLQSLKISFSDLLVGSLIFFIAKIRKISEMILISSLLMPLPLTLCMFIGNLLTYVLPKNQKIEFFLTGVFAGESILTLIFLPFS